MAIEVVEAKEGLDPFYGARGFLAVDCFNLFRVNLNFFHINDEPEVLYLFYPELTFLNINL